MSGAYVAYHPALRHFAKYAGVAGVVKVGESGRLACRLSDSAYTTCWPDGWRYLATFETATREDARRIEAYVLRANDNRRLSSGSCGREMVMTEVDPDVHGGELGEIFLDVAARALGVAGRLRIAPVYEAEPVSASTAHGQSVSPPGPSPRPLPPIGGYAQPEVSAQPDPPAVPELSAMPGLPVPLKAPAPLETPERPAPPRDEDEDADELVCDLDGSASQSVEVVEVPLEERQYQTDAAEACVAQLEQFGRTQLVMACRSGKTRVAHMVVSRMSHGERRAVLFIAPSLQLVRETASKLQRYGDASVAMVGSGAQQAGGAHPDARAGQRAMTTSVDDTAALLAAHFDAPRADAAPHRDETMVLVSTYHSSMVAAEAISKLGRKFSLVVFDECHRTCGDDKPRFSNAVLLRNRELAERCLFMTATPVMDGAGITMRDHSIYGGVAYRYYLRDGIDAGHVNDFEVQLVASSRDAFMSLGVPSPAAAPAAADLGLMHKFVSMIRQLAGTEHRTQLAGAIRSRDGRMEAFCEEKVRAAQIGMAYYHLVAGGEEAFAPRNKMLVFCRTISDAERLCGEVQTLFGMLDRARAGAHTKLDWARVRLFAVHSRMGAGAACAHIQQLQDPHVPAIVFNCRMFQEGVEFMPLNAVFFATPRHSSRDIVQSMCRALTRGEWVDGDRTLRKPRSVVYIPVSGSNVRGEDLGRFDTLLPFADALWSEDSRFYDHLLDPQKPYPLGWIGAHGSAESLLHMARRAVRYGLRASGETPLKDRLTVNANIPWTVAFGELRRITRECRRYPKNNDGFSFARARALLPGGAQGAEPVPVNFSSWFTWVKKQYESYAAGERSELQYHQVRDLESLPHWKTRGLHGPYHPPECLELFERMLEKSGGQMPLVSVSSAEWVGFDSTPNEQLSGFFRVINQQDGNGRKFRVAPAVARELDRICGRWGLRWRKDRVFTDAELRAALSSMPAGTRPEDAARWLAERGAVGELVADAKLYKGRPTAIQDSSRRFHEMAKADPNSPEVQAGWPGYPRKHKHSEHVDVMRDGLAPPRYSSKKGEAPRLVVRGGAPRA